jgi:IS5 family transposase
VVDTTVTASPIKYPTDVNLLETCRTKCVKAIRKAEKTGLAGQRRRTYRRKARREYLRHQKLGRRSKKERRKMQKKLVRYTRRNLAQLGDCIEMLKLSAVTKEETRLLSHLEDVHRKTSSILAQQEQLARGKSVKGRIVSFHHQEVRPMVRGKYPVSVEFGKKNLLVEKDGFLELAGSYHDNVSDTTLMEETLTFCEDTYQETPEGVGADRGFHSPGNRAACEKRGLKRIGIQRKGKPSKNEIHEPWEERIRRRRCGIEAHISLAKRCYGLDRANYRIENGEEMWARMGLVAMNLKRAVRTIPKKMEKLKDCG